MLVLIVGSRRLARSCAALDASSSPTYRHAWTRPPNSCGSARRSRARSSKPHERLERSAGFHLQLRIQVVRERQLRVDGDGAPERFFGEPHQLGIGLRPIFRHHPVSSTEPRPGRRIPRIGADRLQIEIARLRPGLGIASEPVRPQIQLERVTAARHIMFETARLSHGQRQRQRLDDAADQAIQHAKHVVERRLGGRRPQQRASGCFDELRRDAHAIAGPAGPTRPAPVRRRVRR